MWLSQSKGLKDKWVALSPSPSTVFICLYLQCCYCWSGSIVLSPGDGFCQTFLRITWATLLFSLPNHLPAPTEWLHALSRCSLLLWLAPMNHLSAAATFSLPSQETPKPAATRYICCDCGKDGMPAWKLCWGFIPTFFAVINIIAWARLWISIEVKAWEKKNKTSFTQTHVLRLPCFVVNSWSTHFAF